MPEEYTPLNRSRGCTIDKQLRQLSYRGVDGTGWDCTLDKQGRVLRFYETDGTGYRCSYNKQECMINHFSLSEKPRVSTRGLAN
jgi:hypothetical protein